MSFFNWQTEEDEDQLYTEAVIYPHPVKKHGRKLLILFIPLAFIAAGIYWQLDRRADAQAEVFETDVLAAFSIWQQAVTKSDTEIFDTLLVGTEPVWATGQRSLFSSGQLLGRSSLSLDPALNENQLIESTGVEVNLSGDWTTAEVSFQQVYNLIDHPVETLSSAPQINLAQTLYFRRSADRWFLAAPPDDYWGEIEIERKPLLTVTYPDRDKTFALRLAQELSADLTAVCRSLRESVCDDRSAIEIRFETVNGDPAIWRGWETTLVDGRVFLVPSPSLIGQPIDDKGYDLLYQRFTQPILALFNAWAYTPVALPEQDLQLICYPPNGRVPKLVRYLSNDEWTVELPDDSFRYLSPMPSDEGVILQNYIPGQDSSHLRLTLWKNGQETLVFDDAFNHLMLYPAGWSTPLSQTNLLLHGYDQFPTATSFKQLDLNDCESGNCRENGLLGYPVWSPDGRRTIIAANYLHLGDADAIPQTEIGPGFAPFWLDNDHFGYLRYITISDETVQTSKMEVVLTDIKSGSTQQLLSIDEASSLVPELSGLPSYFSYAKMNPADPNSFYLAVRSFKDQHQWVGIFSVDLSEASGSITADRIALAFSLEGATVGFPSLAASNGFVPFVVSTDGRWLTTSRPSPDEPDTWDIFVHDTELNATREYSVGYPSSQFSHPYYDWSKDSNWLVIVEKNYLRLVAPGYNYERLISHSFQTCSHVAWVDPLP